MRDPTPVLVERRLAFGRRVRDLRRERGISQEDLAHLAGVDRSYAGAIERGEQNLSLNNMWRLADALGVHLRDLV